MKFFILLSFATLSFSAFAQTCEVDMVDRYNRVVRTFRAYGDPQTCIEGMKECRKSIRLDYSNDPHYPNGSLDCVRAGGNQPNPNPYPNPNPNPNPNPYPNPNPNPYPNPNPNPYPQIPDEVLRMNELEQAINFTLQNCHVLARVDGWANQLYVNGQFSGNYQAGAQDIELRRVIRDHQMRGNCMLKPGRELQIMFSPNLIQDAIDYTLARNCHVLPRVDGWANQLYINGVFKGNYNASTPTDQAKLKAALANGIVTGQCQERSYEEKRLLQDPYLIQAFANFQYRGCHVRLNVDGWANQVYVANQFKGNYNRTTEVKKLQSALVALVVNGTCRFDPM
jgi:hypothetical protein